MTVIQRKILLTGKNGDLDKLRDLLRQQGFLVHVCHDGAKALEQALTVCPAVMVLDTEIPLLAADKLAQILLSNQRTEAIAFFYVGPEGADLDSFRRHKDQFIVRPFNSEQLLGALLTYYRRQEKTQQVGHQEQDVQGDLGQISLVDLLQIFGLNRKDGTLTLRQGEKEGVIHLLGGRVANAECGPVVGEKAFFRLLGWRKGNFNFHHGVTDVEPQITLPTEHLLMEGLRQGDELAAQHDSFPDPATELVLKVPFDHLPKGLRPTTQEVLLLLQNLQRVQDIVDCCARPDFEVLQILRALLDKGILVEKRRSGTTGPGPVDLLGAEGVIAVKDAFGEGDALLRETSAKIVLLGARGAELRHLVQVLQGLPEFSADTGLAARDRDLLLGEVGSIRVSDTLSVRLFSLPATEETAPLWTPFCRRVFGVLSLGGQGLVGEAEQFFREHGKVPVVRVCFDSPQAEMVHLRPGDRKVWRHLLDQFARHLTP